MKIKVEIDGGSRGNPGPSACAYIINFEDKRKNEKQGFYLGRMTNNNAEYWGLIKALERLVEFEDHDDFIIQVFSDSELMVKQLNGEYRVKNKEIMKLFDKVLKLKTKFADFNIKHVKRENNREADLLLNKILDKCKEM